LGNYLTIALNDPSGKTTNGTKVYAYSGDEKYYQELQSVKGYQSSSSHYLHFGLNKATSLDSLLVVWPDLSRQVLTSVAVNTALTITKAASAQKQVLKAIAISAKRFDVFPLRHSENNFNDDETEKLIPERLSREGPAVLYEDLNADGIKDLFIGNAHGFPARLLQGNGNGTFENLEIEDFTRDARYEDVSVASIDFDGDGDRDLYVASGGSVAKELDKTLEDRIYLNNGNMEFRRIPLSLPHTNGSVVAVADFDQDGYEDIFVGARSIPGSYGLSPYSFVLKNKAGTGVEIAYQERLGMLTDAHWLDFDGDQDLDLVYCGDWMPVAVLENKGDGSLADLPEGKNFPSLNGFWNTLAFADLNQDGQIDILAGNMGANTLFHASKANPVKLFLGDFDGNSAVDPIVFFHYFDRYIPLGSKDKYLSQLPVLKKQFVSYQNFAKVSTFEELFPEGQAQLVETKEVNELRSMLFLSGKDGYQAVPLPDRMQMVNIQDIILDEQGTVYYVGSNQELAAVQSNSTDTKIGVIAGFDRTTNTFKIDHWLDAPNGVNARAIIPLQNGSYLLITNNDYPYLVDLPKF
jgi:hypothetical protein